MVPRHSWISRLESALSRRSVAWLYGVRRVGKTMLCQSMPNVEYFDCELPRTRRRMDDVEGFLSSLSGRTIVLDEIHRLANPSEILKVAADHFPGTRVIATGSSTLQASSRFRDALAGRKLDVWLTPMSAADLADFGRRDLIHRLHRGGLPPFFLAEHPAEREYQEWVDAYWARDISELFRLERRVAFQRLLELLLVQSGGIFEATRLAKLCETSRPTVMNYLSVLEETRVAHVIRPYSSRKASEIVSAPKVYGFDTGFVCHHRGWQTLRDDDLGSLWEHFILNELHAHLQAPVVHYWRDKRGHEVDFILTPRGRPTIAIECKWHSSGFDLRNLRLFRTLHGGEANWLVCHDVKTPYEYTEQGLAISVMDHAEMIRRLTAPQGPPSGRSTRGG